MVIQYHCDNFYNDVLLPYHIRPTHYELRLEPNLIDFTFEGHVVIKLIKTTSLDKFTYFVLHAKDLVIYEGKLVYGDDASTNLSRVGYCSISETATLEFKEEFVIKDAAYVTLKFRGVLNDKMKGFYRTKIISEGTESYAATTHFEPTGARRCFPCWDEPDRKATFDVTLVHDHEFDAISNMPVAQDEGLFGDKNQRTFETTPIMSTYLLAFVVGRFDYLESFDSIKNRRIRVYSTSGKKEQGEFALNVACKSLQYYEGLFGIDYPLRKLDLIAIPDFPIGAMENWGLITYRETCLLMDPKNTTSSGKQWIALVVAHEIAHQWFGNLVTMKWWTDLWLKEGFAQFMEFLCVDHIFPEYDVWSQFVSDIYLSALKLDSLHSSHPIEVPVNHPSEIMEIFDAISYNKGASVIRMLYQYIGHEDFQKGIHDYLLKYSYKNAVTNDLWQALEAASSKPICRMMSGWTTQTGYPWIQVGEDGYEGDDAKLKLSQYKFSADGTTLDEDSSSIWSIPIQLVRGKGQSTSVVDLNLFEDKEATFKIPDARDDNLSWFKFNPGSVGLYHTAHPSRWVHGLIHAVEHQRLPAMDRLNLLADTFALCQAGHVEITDLFTLLKAFRSETNYSVWATIDSCLDRLSAIFLEWELDYLDDFYKFGRSLYRDIFEKITWDSKANESHTDTMLRSLVLNRLISFRDEPVISEAVRRRFYDHYKGIKLLPADLRGPVFKAVSMRADNPEYNRLFDLYDKSDLQEEKVIIAIALGSAIYEQRTERAIEFLLSDKVRLQDKLSVIRPIGRSKPKVAWKLLQDQKDAFRDMFGSHISSLIKYTTENLVSGDAAREVAEFFDKNEFPGGERAVKQSLETIRLNRNWLNRDGDKIKAFLNNQ